MLTQARRLNHSACLKSTSKILKSLNNEWYFKNKYLRRTAVKPGVVWNPSTQETDGRWLCEPDSSRVRSLSESISKQHKTNKQHFPIATKTPNNPTFKPQQNKKNLGWLIPLHMEDSSLGLRKEEIQPHVSFMAKVFQKCSMPQTDVSRKWRANCV